MTDDQQRRVFAKNLLYYIQLNDKQQKEVAEDLGMNASTLNMWCKGNSIPGMGKIQKLADYFGIYFTDLVDEKLNSDDDKLFGELISEIIKKDANERN